MSIVYKITQQQDFLAGSLLFMEANATGGGTRSFLSKIFSFVLPFAFYYDLF